MSPGSEREAVAAELDRLRARFGPFEVREERVENDPRRFAHALDLASEGWLGDAGAFVVDTDDRALFVRHAADPDDWTLPGGGHEPGEGLDDTARREVREETGVDATLAGVRSVVWRVLYRDGEPDRTVPVLRVHFDARVDTARPPTAVGDEEILEARWFTPPDPPEYVAGWLEAWVDAWAGKE
jgi:ADP-ribose pyrophosphatase YjhB (NUDIX family)